MLLGARTSVWSGDGKPTTRDYVQDGLVAMWDSNENVGVGLPHDNTSRVWKNLVSGSPDYNLSTAYFTDDGLHFSNNSASLNGSLPSGAENGTMEFSAEIESGYYVTRFYNAPQIIIACTIDGFQFNPSTSNNCIRGDGLDGVFSATFDNGLVVKAWHNGIEKSLRGWTDWANGSAGILSSYGNYAAVGKLKFIRLYSKKLSDREIESNFLIDKARYGFA